MNNEIKISLNKSKLILLFICSLLFVVLGIYFLMYPETFTGTTYRPRSSTFIVLIGCLAVLFFGICSAYIFKKLFDKKYGLLITKEGIIDNSSGTSIGLIKWGDIVGIETAQVHSQKFIMIKVSNPDYYIGLKKNGLGKIAMKANNSSFGSPISISSNSLHIGFKELLQLIEEQYALNNHKF